MPALRDRSVERGFTLVELLVVILVLALLISLLISLLPSMKRYPRESDRRASCANNLSNIVKCCHLYADAVPNLGMFPIYGGDPHKNGLKSLNLLYDSYVKDHRVFACPSANANRSICQMTDKIAKVVPSDQTKANMDPSHSAYGYSPGHKPADGRVGIASDMTDDPARNSPNHGVDRRGQNVAIAAGSVEWVDSANPPQGSGDVPSDRLFFDDGLPPEQETFIVQ
jgi:prepilin-type N-terminal cleavage/methylation domain-containing protein